MHLVSTGHTIPKLERALVSATPSAVGIPPLSNGGEVSHEINSTKGPGIPAFVRVSGIGNG